MKRFYIRRAAIILNHFAMSRILILAVIGITFVSCSITEDAKSTCTDENTPQSFCAETQHKGFFTTEIVNHVPTKEEATVGNKIKTKKNCIHYGGEWSDDPYYEYCVLPYPDAGNPCHNSKDCVGHCIWPLDEKLVDGKPAENAYGFCQMNDIPDDCDRPHFENGKIIFFNCD